MSKSQNIEDTGKNVWEIQYKQGNVSNNIVFILQNVKRLNQNGSCSSFITYSCIVTKMKFSFLLLIYSFKCKI